MLLEKSKKKLFLIGFENLFLTIIVQKFLCLNKVVLKINSLIKLSKNAFFNKFFFLN